MIACALVFLSFTGVTSKSEQKVLRSSILLRRKGPIDFEMWPRSAHQCSGLYLAIRSIMRSTTTSVDRCAQTMSSMTQMFWSSSMPTIMQQVLSRSWLVETAWSLAA